MANGDCVGHCHLSAELRLDARGIDNVEVCGKIAKRLLRAYALQCDTLTSLRRRGKVGIVEDGRVIRGTRGAPQGAVVSPILANVYLH